MTTNANSLDNTISTSFPTIGFTRYNGLTDGDMRLGAGTTVAAAGSGIVGVASVGSGTNTYGGFRWDATADSGDTLKFAKAVEPTFRTLNPTLRVHGEIRTVNIGTGAAGTVNLTGTAKIAVPGVTAPIVLTGLLPKKRSDNSSYVATATIVTSTGLNGFTEVYWDIAAALSTAQKTSIATLNTDNGLLGVEFTWAPTAAVGTDLNIELIKPTLAAGHHANTRNPTKRT